MKIKWTHIVLVCLHFIQPYIRKLNLASAVLRHQQVNAINFSIALLVVSNCPIPGGPRKKPRNSRYSRFFRILLWLTVTFWSPCWIEIYFPHYNNTKIIKFGTRTFYFMSNFLWTVIFGICPISRFPRHNEWQINGKSRKWQSIRNYS